MELLEEDGELQSWERGLSGEMTAGMALLQSLELARAPQGGSTLRYAPAPRPPRPSPPQAQGGGALGMPRGRGAPGGGRGEGGGREGG